MARRSHNPGQPSRTPSGMTTNPVSARVPQQRQPTTTGAGFINPYNFVRFLPRVVLTDLTGRNGPPLRTHEKFSGLSGRVVVELTTITPLCIPDAEATTVNPIADGPQRGEERFTKPFCRVDSKPYVPGTALKGMLRSTAEAVSNSCFSVFTENMAIFRDNRSYVPRQRGVGLLSRLPSGSLRLDDPAPGSPNASGVRFPRRGLFNQDSRSYFPRPNNPKARGQTVPGEIRDLYRQMVRDENFTREEQHPNNAQLQWLLDFSSNEAWWFREVSVPDPRAGRYHQRVITFGRNFRYKWAYDPRAVLPLQLNPCKEPHRLCPCCALFGMVEQRENEETEETKVNAFAGKVAIGPARWIEGNCDSGWVNDHKILGTPKFSCRSFYLAPSNPAAFNVGQDEFVSLDATGKIQPNHIRGRKFYWHHTKVWQNSRALSYVERLPLPNGQRPDETQQNARIEVLMPSAKFEFTVDFENLSDWELGLLLWTIALPDVPEGAHHLGLGKPIGLGTVVLRVKRLDLIDRCRLCSGLFETGVEQQTNLNLADEQGLGKYTKAFREKMQSWHNREFHQLDNVKDLVAILSRQQPAPASATVSIVYPPGNREEPELRVNKKELHYQWFGGMRWSEPLRTIEEITDGSTSSGVQTLFP